MKTKSLISAADVKVGDCIRVHAFGPEPEARGVVSRIETTQRHHDRAGLQTDYVFYHLVPNFRGEVKERRLAGVPFGFNKTIERVG